MNNIYYLDDEILGHLTSRKKSHLLWRYLYKRVLKKINKSLISPSNIKKIIYNKNRKQEYLIESVLPFVSIRNQESWVLHSDEEEYFLPLSISFSDRKVNYTIVLINGEIDLRIINEDKENGEFDHFPMLVLLALKTFEECFSILLELIEKEN